MICLKDHSQGAEILTDYCAGRLDAIRAAELQAHLHECAICRDEVDAQREVWTTLDAWRPVEVSRDFDNKLYARVHAEQTAPWWSLAWKPVIPAAAAAGLLAIALLTWGPGLQKPANQMPPSNATATEKIDVQQVEQALDDMDLLIPVNASPRAL
jgi:anti-sigma factor RsiW